jgi:hypothetical protein
MSGNANVFMSLRTECIIALRLAFPCLGSLLNFSLQLQQTVRKEVFMVLLFCFEIQPIRCEFNPTSRQIYLNEKIIQCIIQL